MVISLDSSTLAWSRVAVDNDTINSLVNILTILHIHFRDAQQSCHPSILNIYNAFFQYCIDLIHILSLIVPKMYTSFMSPQKRTLFQLFWITEGSDSVIRKLGEKHAFKGIHESQGRGGRW